MIQRRTLLLGSAAILALSPAWFVLDARAAPAGSKTENDITLKDESGRGVNAYPLRIGRPFVAGEIANLPAAFIDGKPVPTQADVTLRWPDGSVKHAILSFVVPAIAPRATMKVAFRDSTAAQGAALTAEQMLAPAFDFDALMELSLNGQSQIVSARRMLMAGDFTIWCKGPIATTIVLADHSTARKYDAGFEDTRPVRPIFHATFWPGLHKVQVRVIGENVNSEAMRDTTASVSIHGGAASPKAVFRWDNVNHYAGSRWTRTFWIGGAPDARINIDHNLAYIAATRAFPNFDMTVKVAESTIAARYAFWQSRSKALYDAGLWEKYMPTTGGRNDIGPFTGDEALWLYTGDWRMLEIVSRSADLAAAWPMQCREGDPSRKFDKAQKIAGLGKPVSVYARPKLWLFDDRGPGGKDNITHKGPRILIWEGKAARSAVADLWSPEGGWPNGQWMADSAHQPDPYSAVYTLTGDPFYLEQVQFWAAKDCVASNPDYKGPPPNGVLIGSGELRGKAWMLRNVVNAAFLSPDASPEKTYFEAMLDDSIAAWEGQFDIRGTAYANTLLWKWWNQSKSVHPLFLVGEMALEKQNNMGLNSAVASSTAGLWQQYFMIFELGRAVEKGYAFQRLLSYAGKGLIGQVVNAPGYDPVNIVRYYTGTRDVHRIPFKAWAETVPAYTAPMSFPLRDDPNNPDSYAAYAYGAASMLTAEPGGKELWDFMRARFYDDVEPSFAAGPKWAYLPRT